MRGRAYRRAKRLMDLSLVVLGLPLILTVLALCWCAIKLESPLRPALFVQPRTGLRGKRFPMLKFRTMVPDAEEIKGDLLAYSKLRWPDFKMDNDPRVTRVGRILRTTSLDELPQIFNVVKGDMSLVGPRPTSFAADTYEPWQRPRLRVLPGLTGLWQISGRASLEFDERVRLDLAYIKVRSLSVDFQILARTFGAVLFRRGAS